MTGLEHTFLAVACLAIAYWLGSGRGYNSGYVHGVENAIESVFKQLEKDGIISNTEIKWEE